MKVFIKKITTGTGIKLWAVLAKNEDGQLYLGSYYDNYMKAKERFLSLQERRYIPIWWNKLIPGQIKLGWN